MKRIALPADSLFAPKPGSFEPQRTQRVCIRERRCHVYCGRWNRTIDVAQDGADGYFGNPYSAKRYSPEQALALYVEYLITRLEGDTTFRTQVESLKGLDLGCWCPLQAECHVDWLVLAAEGGGALSCECPRRWRHPDR